MNAILQGAVGWLLVELMNVLFGAAGAVYTFGEWMLGGGAIALRVAFNEIWAWTSEWLIAKLSNVLGGWVLPVVPLEAWALITTGARSLNWILPVDMLVTMLPLWATFEVGCFSAKLLRVTIWG